MVVFCLFLTNDSIFNRRNTSFVYSGVIINKNKFIKKKYKAKANLNNIVIDFHNAFFII